MSLRINSNIPAMSALRHIEQTDGAMSKTMTRLSTGMRINDAADDPAGLVFSENVRSHVQGIQAAIRNTQDAVNMAKTAEGALSEIATLLSGMRALAVHSANSAVVDGPTVRANQNEIRSALDSINRIAQSTRFGNKQLLNGSAGTYASVTSAANVSLVDFSGTFNGHTVVNGAVTIDQTTAATRASVTLGNTFSGTTATVTGVGSFVINGYTFQSTGTETVESLIAKINEKSNQTGVQAQAVTSGGNTSIVLNQTNYGSQFAINFFDPANVLHTSGSATATGVDGVYNVTVTTTQGAETIAFTGGRSPGDSGLVLSDGAGNRINLTEVGNATIAAPTEVGFVTAGAARFQIGSDSDQSVTYSLPNVIASRLGTGVVSGKSVEDIDVTTEAGAQEAIRIIEAAISQLAETRGNLGSFTKNFLESNVRSLEVQKENLTAAESAIRDANLAEEMTNLTRYQILQQSGMAMLSQANQQPSNVLRLLQQ
ncbi:MAG: hypothetical protein KIS66_14450 [Fimbriimonadaceae bacterium]|nr:hypothetical protein [Fimbriimonadaceae bacterium]